MKIHDLIPWNWGKRQVPVRREQIEVTAELPGMDEKDIDVSLAEGVLTIRGEKRSEVEKKEKDYYLQERTFGSVERVIPLPDTVDLDTANATFKNGVLTVKLAKRPEAMAATKRIAVRRA